MGASIKSKRRFKFNFIDVILLLIIIVAGVMLYLIFRPGSKPEETPVSNKTEIIYVIEAREVMSDFKGNVNIGDKIVDSVGLYPIGEVVDVTYSDTPFVYKANGDGKVVYSYYPDKINITIKVKASAQISGGAYSIGGYEIAVGTPVYFRVPNLTGSSYCISIEQSSL